MCDYQELMMGFIMADMSAMLTQQLKSRIQAGDYKPEASLVADAMLRRRSVRELLTGAAAAAVTSAGRSHAPAEQRRQAA
jgi:hypothetical protein